MDRRRYLAAVTGVIGSLCGCGSGGQTGDGGSPGRPTSPADTTPVAATATRTATPRSETRQAVDAAAEALRQAADVIGESAGQFEGFRTDVDFDATAVSEHLGEAEAALDDAEASVTSRRGRTAVDALRGMVAFLRSLADLLATLTEAATATGEMVDAIRADDRFDAAISAGKRAHEGFESARGQAPALRSDVGGLHPEAVEEILDVDRDRLRQRIEGLATYATRLSVYTEGLRYLAPGVRDLSRGREELEADNYGEATDRWRSARQSTSRAHDAFEGGTDDESVIAALADTAAVLESLATTMEHVTAVLEHLDIAGKYRDAEQYGKAVEELRTASGPLDEAESSAATLKGLRDDLSPRGFDEATVFEYSTVIDATRIGEGYATALGVLVPGSREYFAGRSTVTSARNAYASGDFATAAERFATARSRFDEAHTITADASLPDETPSDLHSAVRDIECRSGVYRSVATHVRRAAEAAVDGDAERKQRQEKQAQEALQALDECP